ncbi:hypothetical protein C1Y40_03963 [Mycobacterium talmoniae]|uniref:Uncharacterized protein n=1 Tax=Mycobacterium talmoniae TaxID=1858794 RepID=A0A2S8BGS5_9MYCO|nr:hypothetical protein C1Y40_03963 [Mycobacterium talmoniae]
MLQGALGLCDQQGHGDRDNHQQDQTGDEQSGVGRAAVIGVERIGHRQPPNLAPALTPHIAIVSSAFKMITTVMVARIAWPAATPTPCGPPEA